MLNMVSELLKRSWITSRASLTKLVDLGFELPRLNRVSSSAPSRFSVTRLLLSCHYVPKTSFSCNVPVPTWDGVQYNPNRIKLILSYYPLTAATSLDPNQAMVSSRKRCQDKCSRLYGGVATLRSHVTSLVLTSSQADHFRTSWISNFQLGIMTKRRSTS